MNANAVIDSGVIGPMAPGWSLAAIGDYNGDRHADILLKSGSQLAVWQMNGTQLQTGSGGIDTLLGPGWSAFS